jgi:hypothetical protein
MLKIRSKLIISRKNGLGEKFCIKEKVNMRILKKKPIKLLDEYHENIKLKNVNDFIILLIMNTNFSP